MKINPRLIIKAIQQDAVESNFYLSTLKDYEQKLRFILEKSRMYIWRTDKEKGITAISRSLYGMEHFLTYKEFLQLVSDECLKERRIIMERISKAEEPIHVTCRFKPSGLSQKYEWYELSGVPAYDDEGKATGYFGLSHEVTRQMELERQLSDEAMRAKASYKQKDEFLANMMHEIRTPLNSIVGFSDLILRTDEPEQRQFMLNIFRCNCYLLMHVIENILTTAEIDAGKLTFKPRETDFAALFDNTFLSLKQWVESMGIEFQKENPYTTLTVKTDPERIRQVITHFVTNAVKFAPEGKVSIGYRLQDGGLYIYCKDTGVGIEKNQQELIFERFAKLNNFIQGSGLGLYICKVIADSCQGRIGVESEGKGKGATFWFWCPL